MLHVEQSWPGVAASVSEARRFVCRTLSGWGVADLEWAAVALVSELATNAVLHAGTEFAVGLALEDERLRLEVKDGSPMPPVVRHYGRDSTTGRGLRLVVELSEQWGVEPGKSAKTVWCVLTTTAPATMTYDDEVDDADVEALLAQFDDSEPAEASGSSPAQRSVAGPSAA